MSHYALQNAKWGSTERGTPGGSISWSLNGNFDPQFRSEIESAFAQWASAANIQFNQLADNQPANILVSWAALDGPGGFPAQTSGFFSGGSFLGAHIRLDSTDVWTPSAGGLIQNGVYFEAAMLREIGLSIGLANYNGAPAIMNTTLPAGVNQLLSSDFHGAAALYGSGIDTASFSNAQLAIQNFGASAAAGGWSSDDLFHRELADVNGDGRADIVGFGIDGALVALANNTGGFGPAQLAVQNFGSSPAAGGWTSDDKFHREMADVNGDGRADVVGFGIAGTYVALGNDNGGFGQTQLVLQNFGTSPSAGGWASDDQFHREMADVNGDGRADIVGFGIAGTYVALGNNNGGFGDAQLVLQNFGTSAAAGGWTNDDQFHRTLADVNGDGRVDIVGFGIDGTLVALAESNGGFGQAQLVLQNFGTSGAAGGWTSDKQFHRTLADVSGDGRADIVGFGIDGTLVALANSNVGFGPAELALNNFGTSAAGGGWTNNDRYPRDVADVNGDGFADLVGFGEGGVYLALNDVLLV